ncbi:MAG: hypothetical protein M0Q90_08970 [Bacteroidales bacterium]|nr:hypothetical protein [Bacteroidales bacterium]
MTNKLLISTFLAGVLSFSNSCEKLMKDDELVLQKQNYTGNQLRLDGYYYEEFEEKYYSIYFFYEDGTLLYGDGGFTKKEFIEHEKEFTKDVWLNGVKSYKAYWGLFMIENDSIVFERWYPSSGGPFPAHRRSGKILNDTTFLITKSIRSNGKEEQKLNEIYHFKKFSPKPDSTNVFIK